MANVLIYQPANGFLCISQHTRANCRRGEGLAFGCPMLDQMLTERAVSDGGAQPRRLGADYLTVTRRIYLPAFNELACARTAAVASAGRDPSALTSAAPQCHARPPYPVYRLLRADAALMAGQAALHLLPSYSTKLPFTPSLHGCPSTSCAGGGALAGEPNSGVL